MSTLKIGCQADGRASAGALRRLILKIARHAGVRENAGDSVLVDVDAAGGRGSVHHGQRAEPVIGVVGEIAFHGARQRRAVAPDARHLPAADDLVQPARRVMQERLALAEGQRIHEIRVEVVADVEIRRAAERAQIVNVLDGRALFSGAGFGRRTVVDGVRPGVIEIELEAVGDSAGGTRPSGRGNRLRPRSSTSAWCCLAGRKTCSIRDRSGTCRECTRRRCDRRRAGCPGSCFRRRRRRYRNNSPTRCRESRHSCSPARRR